ncbi:MAG: bifunctional folylpolyglutamate synthase/dihydrofolate synthase [Ruminococcaceae bacterium]|nr:bifunctional folylpolyglutamate synthase/dihydrofolate synthase [Oscillospiraceae bacterium]
MNLTYNEFLEQLFSIKRFGKTPNLLVMEEILKKLDNPHEKLKFIHIAGTNGKGSVCNYIASALMEKGCRTGLFTSPFIHRFNERFKINGKDIDDSKLAELGSRVMEIAREIPYEVKQFDIITAIAILWFYEGKCDYVVLEAGMGGRNDSTNIITPVLSVITTIDLDHTKILGDTGEKIAFEKAGIIKENIPLVYYPTEYEQILKDECLLKKSPFGTIENPGIIKCDLSGTEFMYKGSRFYIKMYGAHQVFNACLAIEALRQLGVEEAFIATGIGKMQFEGRFEKLSDKPLVFIDGGHNPQGAKTIVETVKQYKLENPCFVVSVYKEKDAEGFMKNILGNGEIIVTSFDDSMCHDRFELAHTFNLPTHELSEIVENIKNSGDDKTYIFCGSLYQISKIKSFFDKT